MIPAALAWKIGGSAGALLLVGGSIFAYNTYRENIGEARAEARMAADLLEQHQEATGHYIVQNTLKLRSVEETMGEKDVAHARLRKTYQSVLQIVNEQREPPTTIPVLDEEPDEQTCAVRPALVSAVNDLGRVLNETATGGHSPAD